MPAAWGRTTLDIRTAWRPDGQVADRIRGGSSSGVIFAIVAYLIASVITTTLLPSLMLLGLGLMLYGFTNGDSVLGFAGLILFVVSRFLRNY
jgi:hypothetical protein